jgi:hypothetical protein
VLILPKNFSLAKFECKYLFKNAEFYAEFKTFEKNAKKLLIKKLQEKSGETREFALFSINNLLKF